MASDRPARRRAAKAAAKERPTRWNTAHLLDQEDNEVDVRYEVYVLTIKERETLAREADAFLHDLAYPYQRDENGEDKHGLLGIVKDEPHYGALPRLDTPSEDTLHAAYQRFLYRQLVKAVEGYDDIDDVPASLAEALSVDARDFTQGGSLRRKSPVPSSKPSGAESGTTENPLASIADG